MSQDAALLEDAFSQALPPVNLEGESLAFVTLTQLPPLFAKEAIHRFLRRQGCQEPLRSQIEEIFKLVLRGQGGWEVQTKGCLVQGRQGRLWGQRR